MAIEKRAIREAARRARIAAKLAPRQCLWCLAPFVPSHTGAHYYCCDAHNNIAKSQRRKARLRGAAEGEPVSRWVVYALSQGICGLCHEPVDESLRWPNQQCASVDHIIPITRGGKDSLDNLQLAHLGCNLKKQNKLPGETRKVWRRRQAEAVA